jgi:hypothetical protein
MRHNPDGEVTHRRRRQVHQSLLDAYKSLAEALTMAASPTT